MKGKTRTIVASIVATTIVIASGSALAWRHGGASSERMVERVSEKLELDQSQQAALTVLVEEISETREMMRGDEENLRASIGSMITAETFDQGTALSMIEQRTSAVQAQAPELVASAATFIDGLSSEQKADIASFLERHEGKRSRH